MSDLKRENTADHTCSCDNLAQVGYWPALAAKAVNEGRFANAVELCADNIHQQPQLLSGRVVYGTALYRTGQIESAREQFHFVLASDPDNLVALKHMADISNEAGDVFAAMANYQRILAIDPHNGGLKCELNHRQKETTRTISIRRGEEVSAKRKTPPSKPIPFFTETMGDLYLAQGHSRLAAEVFRNLTDNNSNPRLQQKLTQAEGKIRDKGN